MLARDSAELSAVQTRDQALADADHLAVLNAIWQDQAARLRGPARPRRGSRGPAARFLADIAGHLCHQLRDLAEFASNSSEPPAGVIGPSVMQEQLRPGPPERTASPGHQLRARPGRSQRLSPSD